MTADARLRRFLVNRTAGASELALEATVLIDLAEQRGIAPRALQTLRRRLAAAHPAMAAVHNAVEARDRSAFRKQLRHSQLVARRALRAKLPRGATVVTISYSSSVLAALARRDLVVVVAESLPGGEGRRTLRKLRTMKVHAHLVPDGLTADAVAKADAVVVGADAITPSVVVNKAGTLSLALSAQYHHVPCYVIADRSKVVGASWPLPRCTSRSPFEATPRRLFTRVFAGER